MSKKSAAFVAQLSLLLVLLMALATPGVPQNPSAPPQQRPRKVYPNEQEPEDVVRVDTDLGSDSSTRAVVRPADTGNRYYVTDNQGRCCDPAVAHVIGGGTAVTPSITGVVDGNDQISTTWRATVPAHGTIIVMHFAIQRGFTNAADAQVEADLLSTLSDPLAVSGLTAAERAQIVNFTVP